MSVFDNPDSFPILARRWRGTGFSLEFDSRDEPWYQKIINKYAPQGVRKSTDPPMVLDVSITIEGHTKHFKVHRANISTINYRDAMMSMKLECDQMEEVASND